MGITEDREIVEIAIKKHEGEGYIKDGYEIIHFNIRRLGDGYKEVKLSYKDKVDKTICIINAELFGERVLEYEYFYAGHELIKAMYKAIEGEGEA